MVELTRKEYNIIAKNRGIIEPQNTTTQELINTPARYDSRCEVKNSSRKLLKIGLEKLLKYKIFQKMNSIKSKSFKKKQWMN